MKAQIIIALSALMGSISVWATNPGKCVLPIPIDQMPQAEIPEHSPYALQGPTMEITLSKLVVKSESGGQQQVSIPINKSTKFIGIDGYTAKAPKPGSKQWVWVWFHNCVQGVTASAPAAVVVVAPQ